MAHEFLTWETMLGRKLYPGWAEVGPLDSPSQKHREVKKKAAHQSYSKVANVFKTDGTHVPGVVNPTQLAKWIQIDNMLAVYTPIKKISTSRNANKKKGLDFQLLIVGFDW
ncbi:unnamed protein product [Brassica napus]|uniref:(rape) hypothetical protein n=1 Tax=Brassica napus TaxID=3708 RepID=A0A816YH71_BRANA|nr:unnamed protein product [Brassica napus]